MSRRALKIIVLGLSISSSWGNGHATTYRALLKSVAARGHHVLFLERDVPWYAAHRDLEHPDFCALKLYGTIADLQNWRDEIADADVVIVGSYVPDGIEVGRLVQSWATGCVAFYDIDTPVTVAALDAGKCAYLSPELIPGYDLYLSFSGGPLLDKLMSTYRASATLPLYCAVDTDSYYPVDVPKRWDLSYLGTHSDDRQPTLDRLLLETARLAPELSFAVAGPQYPTTIDWPRNVERLEHVAPADHPAFYCASRFTLNVTRHDMIMAGFSPSVRLFEAAACGVPVLSDNWAGIETFFRPDEELILVDHAAAVLRALRGSEASLAESIGQAARGRILREHTAIHRAEELEDYLNRILSSSIQTRTAAF